MYFSGIPRLSVFCDWLFLVFSSVSLQIAANFLFFLKVARILREKLCELWRLNWFCSFLTKKLTSSIIRGKRFQQKQTMNIVEFGTKPRSYSFFFNNDTIFVSPIYTFSLAGNKTVCTPLQGTNKEKYFNHINLKGRRPNLAGNEHISVHLFSHRPHLFHLLTEKCTGLIG